MITDSVSALSSIQTRASSRQLGEPGNLRKPWSRDRAAGSHPYLVTPEHTARAREILGDAPLLAPEAKVVLDTDPDSARATARDTLSRYLALPNYTKALQQFGFTEDDFADGGSDRLVDALFAWGDDDRVRARLESFHAAGADHVAVQVVDGGPRDALPRAAWRRLAELLRSGSRARLSVAVATV
ncbi:LLM class F420-dependent oxidoreductase, partial [Streptomyces sp. NPDC008222]